MMKLPGLDNYSEDELKGIQQKSAAFQNYYNQYSNLTLEPLEKDRLENWMMAAAVSLQKRGAAKEVCRSWSDFTDDYIKASWKAHKLDKENLCVFALGKLGAQELNLSSDIDILIVSETLVDYELEKKVIKWIQSMPYRVDLDLRPGGRFGPLIPSLSQMEDYYWSRGATWERLALVRLRSITGQPGLRDKAKQLLEKFCYRKFLDFRLLDDLKNLRTMIQENTQESKKSVHLKLGSGGIRDIELFVNALQVIHGGKDSSLRVNQTSQAIEALKNKSILDNDNSDTLLNTYWYLRDLENHVQAVNDEQTHLWSPQHGADEIHQLKNSMFQVDAIVTELLGRPSETQKLPGSLENQLSWMSTLGYKIENIKEIWENIIRLNAQSLSSQNDEAYRRLVLYRFVTEIANGIDPKLGLLQLLDFIRGTRAKAGFFALLLHNPRLIEDLAQLFSISPYLSQTLATRPELLDSFILRTVSDFSNELEHFLQQASDRKLLAEILLAVQFLQTNDFTKVEQQVTQTADDIINHLLKLLTDKYGSNTLSALPLGKWASRELGFLSDLDFIFVSKTEPNQTDHQIARRVVSHLTQSGRPIYDIDLRLRPTGKAGPLLVTETKLLDYMKTEAAPWERQSYYRLRPDNELAKEIQKIIVERKFDSNELQELEDIRNKLYKKSSSNLDIKYYPGGLLDIEFSVQIAAIQLGLMPSEVQTMQLIESLSSMDQNWLAHKPELQANYKELRTVEQLFQLVAARTGTVLSPQNEDCSRLSKLLKLNSDELISHLKSICDKNHQILKKLDPIWTSS